MNKRGFVFLILVLASVLVIWQFFWPAFGAVLESRAQLKIWEASLSDTEDLSKKLQLLKTKFDKMEGESEMIAAALPTAEEVPAILVQLEALSSQNGLILNSINFIREDKKAKTISSQQASPTAGTKTLPIEISLSGSFASLENFLKSTENNLRLMDVDTLTFGQESTGIPGELMNATIGLTVYYR